MIQQEQTQKQWIFSNLDLLHLRMAVATEIDQHRKSARPVPHHLVNLEELAAKLSAIAESTARLYDETDKEDEGVVCERLLVTLVPFNINEGWDTPYTVIPYRGKFAVVYRDTLRPVNEQLYKHPTHAYRACRRLNADYQESEAIAEAEVTITIDTLLKRLPEGYPPAQFSKGTTGYMLMIENTMIFQGATAEEAIKHTTNYIEERERHPDLPVGVIYGVYD